MNFFEYTDPKKLWNVSTDLYQHPDNIAPIQNGFFKKMIEAVGTDNKLILDEDPWNDNDKFPYIYDISYGHYFCGMRLNGDRVEAVIKDNRYKIDNPQYMYISTQMIFDECNTDKSFVTYTIEGAELRITWWDLRYICEHMIQKYIAMKWPDFDWKD